MYHFILITLIKAVIIDYSMLNPIIQATGNILTLNITNTFPSNDLQIQIVFPPQVTDQANIVCGVSGLTSGTCQLMYSKFYITFKSATPSFQIKFLNMQNPISNYSEKLKINCSIISTGQLLFEEQIQLAFQLKSLNFVSLAPMTTYQADILSLTFDKPDFVLPETNTIRIVTTGYLNQSVPTGTNITIVAYEVIDATMLVQNAKISGDTFTISLSQFMAPSLQPITFTVSIEAQSGIIAKSANSYTPKIVGTIKNLKVELASNIAGYNSSIRITICNLIKVSVLTAAVPSEIMINKQLTNLVENNCQIINYESITNPLKSSNFTIGIQVQLSNYLSLRSEYQMIIVADKLLMNFTQNNTEINKPTLITLTIFNNLLITNPKIILQNPYNLIECYSDTILCQGNEISLPGNSTKYTINFITKLPGCDMGVIMASIYSSNQIIANTNSIKIAQSSYNLSATLTSTSNIVDSLSIVTISLIQWQVFTTKFTIESEIQLNSCNQCSITGNLAQYSGNQSQFSLNVTNPYNNKPYIYTIKAYNDQCLLGTTTLGAKAEPITIKLEAVGNNNIYNQLSNWTVATTPNIQLNGFLKVPINMDGLNQRFNSTHIQIVGSNITLNNLRNLIISDVWQATFLSNGYIHAIGSVAVGNYVYAQFDPIVVTYSTGFNSTTQLDGNVTILYDIPINGTFEISSSYYNITNVIINNQPQNSAFQLLKGTYSFQALITHRENQTNSMSGTIVINSFDQNHNTLQRQIVQQNIVLKCNQENCSGCQINKCQQCANNFTLQNGTCSNTNSSTNTTQCDPNQVLVNGVCVSKSDEALSNNGSNQSDKSNYETDDAVQFTPPVISSVVGAIIMFAIFTKLLHKNAEMMIIYYSLASMLEHIITIFLFIYYFVNLNIIFGFSMLTLIIIHFSAQMYMVLIQILKIDPEYIGVRQQYKGLKILHMISITFCGRLMLLLTSKIGQSFIWNTPWTHRVSIITKIQNVLKFQLFQQFGLVAIVVMSMLTRMYLFYIEILCFTLLQIGTTLYTYQYLRNLKNNEIRLTYI